MVQKFLKKIFTTFGNLKESLVYFLIYLSKTSTMKNIVLTLCTIFMISCGSSSDTNLTEKSDYFDINGTWTLLEMSNINVELPVKNNPFLTIDNDKISGSNGCNNFFGSLQLHTNNSLQIFGIGETKRLCFDMKIPDAFNNLLQKTSNYLVTSSTLTLLDDSGEKLLTFRKK